MISKGGGPRHRQQRRGGKKAVIRLSITGKRERVGEINVDQREKKSDRNWFAATSSKGGELERVKSAGVEASCGKSRAFYAKSREARTLEEKWVIVTCPKKISGLSATLKDGEGIIETRSPGAKKESVHSVSRGSPRPSCQ